MSIFPKSISPQCRSLLKRNTITIQNGCSLNHTKTAYCIPLSGHHIRSRSRPYFCMVLQIRNNGKDTSIHSKSSEQGFDKVEKFRG